MKTYKNLVLLILLFFSCKNIDNKDSSRILESTIKNTSKIELPQLIPNCVFKDGTELFVKTSIQNELLVSLNNVDNLSKSQLKINLNELDFINNEISNTKIECNENSFVLKYIEQLGNNYSNTYHVFSLDEKTKKPIWSKIYRIENTRQGFEIYGKLLKHINISSYDGNENNEADLFSIYLFNGYQDGKEPQISTFYDTIKSSKNLALFCDKIVLTSLIKNIPIDKKNLSQFNAISHIIQKEGFNKEAIFILENIIKAFPKSEEAYVKIGDAYWEIGDQERAKKFYNSHIELSNNENKKIPQRVFTRTK